MENVRETSAAQAAQADFAPASAKRHWTDSKLGKVAIWTALGIGGFFLNEGITWARDVAMDRPDYLKQLTEHQQEQFAEVKKSLQEIGGSISSGDRAAFRQVEGAVADIQRSNTSLIQQLILAKQEYETLRNVARDTAGISGGYDFILSEDSGLRIDDAAVFGLASVGGGGVRVNVSGQDGNATNGFLRPGEAVSYLAKSGRSCTVSLLSFNAGSVGTASFAKTCS